MILFITFSDNCQSSSGFSVFSLTDENGTDFSSLLSSETIYFSQKDLCEELADKIGVAPEEILLEET